MTRPRTRGPSVIPQQRGGSYKPPPLPAIVPDERDGCTINGAVMSLAKGTADLLAIAEGRHHVG